MTASIPKSFDAVAHGSGTPYLLVVSADASVPAKASVSYQPRADQYPLRRGVVPVAREIPFRLIKGTTAMSDEEWFTTVRQLYDPSRGVRLLVVDHEGVDVQLPVDVLSFEPQGVLSQIAGVFGAVDAAWTGTTAVTDTTSTTTPDGTTDCLPVITLTPTANCKVVEIEITANNPGGFADFPIQIGGGGATEGATWDCSVGDSATPQDFIVFHDGRPIPFFLQGTDANRKMHCLAACREGETITLTVFYGAAINNTVTAQKFAPGGLDLTAMSNATWVWRNASTTIDSVYQPSVWEVLSAPRRPGSWHPSTVGSGAPSYYLFESSTTEVTLQPGTSGFENNADAVVLVCPVPAATSNALLGFYLEELVGRTEIATQTKYLRSGDSAFRTATKAAAGTYDLDNAQMIAFVTYPNAAIEIGQHAGTAPPQLDLDPDYLPTVTIGTPEDAVVLGGTLTNSTTGDIVYITDTYFKVQDLVIDTLGTVGPTSRNVETANADPLFFGTPNAGVTFSNRRQWWPMRAGVANTWAWSGTSGVSVSLSLKPRFLLL